MSGVSCCLGKARWHSPELLFCGAGEAGKAKPPLAPAAGIRPHPVTPINPSSGRSPALTARPRLGELSC